MKQKLIKDRLTKEIAVLWELSKKNELSDTFREHVRDSVQRIRREIVQNPPSNLSGRSRSAFSRVDVLQQKLDEHGNTGFWGRERIRQLSQIIFQDKSPESIDLGKWISVEIECLFWNSDAESNFISFVRKLGASKYVTLKEDGSIRANEERPECSCPADGEGRKRHTCNYEPVAREIVVSFKDGEWDLIKNICSKLMELKTLVNKTCGLHVHFDCRHLSQRQVTTLGKRVAFAVPALKQILPKSRSNNRFCSRDINSHRGNNRENRYSFVNLMSYERHKTLEIRGHSGTVDGTKIVNWIRILQKIMLKRNRQVVSTASEMVTKYNFEPDLVNYVFKRFNKFNPVVANNVSDDVVDDHAIVFNLSEIEQQNDVIANLEEIVRSMENRAQEQRDAHVLAATTVNGDLVINGTISDGTISANNRIMREISNQIRANLSMPTYTVDFDAVVDSGIVPLEEE